MDNKRILAVASLKKRNILKGNGAFDIHNVLRKIESKLPRDSLVLQKHRFCGLQTTPLEEELDEEGNPLPGHEPYNQVDDVCRQHDFMYSKAKNKADKHKADKVMLDSLKKLKPKNFREKVDKAITRTLIGSKYKLGLGVQQKQILKELF